MQEQPDKVIEVRELYKSFKLPHEKHSGIKQALIGMFNGKKGYEVQKTLKNISFNVKRGEFFGIVGRNGSGKSTLLKLLAGIYTPDRGLIQVNGSLTPFIELGVGFNPELTGRENIFLNGALLGLSRKEVSAIYDDIVAFAELEKFMDQKLKNYSSGMQVRLAFSIAIRAQSDILILDEVLAVGDEAFQRKCLDVFENYKLNKKTVVLVTHDMAVVEKYCDRAILIDQGDIIEEGQPARVSKKYSSLNNQAIDSSTSKQNKARDDSHKLKIKLKKSTGAEASTFELNDEMTVSLDWPAHLPVENAGVAIVKSTGEMVFANNTVSLKDPIEGHHTDYKIALNLLPGRYFIMAGIFGKTDKEVVDFVGEGPVFSIKNNGKIWQGVTVLENNWSDSRTK